MTRPPLTILFIAVATALSILGDAMMYAVLPGYYVHIGLTPFQVGILLSVNRWVRLASNQVAERCYRESSVILWLIPAYLIGSLVTTTYAFFRNFVVLLSARILWGVCFSFIRQAGIMTVVNTSDDVHLGEHMGFYRAISSSGWFLGMQANLRIMLCGFAVGVVGLGLIMSTLGLLLKEQIGISINLFGRTLGVATLTGAVLAIRWILVGVGSPVLGAIADRIGRERSIPFLFVIGAIVIGLTGFRFGLPWMMSGVLMLFCCETLLDILITARAGQQGARFVASYVTAHDFGSALGPLIGWSIVQFDLTTGLIFFAAAVFYIMGAFMSRFLASLKHPWKEA